MYTTVVVVLLSLAIMKLSPPTHAINTLLVMMCTTFSLGCSIPAGWQVGQTVNTTSGLITGHAASNLTQVSEYLGIPYAQPPVESQRFKAPQAYISSNAFNASTFSPDCPANVPPVSIANAGIPNLAGSQAVNIIDNIQQFGHQISEDCLKVNVWTKPQTGESKKAVLVWIYGGGFQTGTTNTFLYNGQVLADLADVVVVSLNYRINVFGFPGLPGMDQNVGLLDQRLAIEWVRSNIAAFGGDPSRITLFGQSAGAASIDFYSYAWTADPIVAGLISESGVATSFVNPTPLNNTAIFYSLASNLNCGTNSTLVPTTIACMQGKTMQQILTGMASLGLQFQPTIDSKTVFSDYDALTKAGKFIKKPVLIGNNDYEAGIIKVIFQQSGLTQSLQAWALLNLQTFTCPVGHRAAGKTSHVPTWRYRYFGEFENTRLTVNPDSGAWHGSEIATVFGTTSGSGVPNSKLEVEVLEYIAGAWVAFAKNPTSGLAAAPYQWPQYNQDTASLVRLGFNNQTTASYIYPVTYDYACAAVLAPGGPNMTVINGIANFTALGGGAQVGF